MMEPSEGVRPDVKAPAHRVAVLIPCYNEELTVAQVVRDFKAQLPEASLYVFDNNSTDQTVRRAAEAGAIIGHEVRQGKGYVLRSMFRQIDADIYVMVDGDGTYPPEKVHDLIGPVLRGEADVVVGSRLLDSSVSGFKPLNLMGNKLLRLCLNVLFRVHVTDLLSGYRAMHRRVVKGLPFLSCGFESETELTVKCLQRGYRMLEVPVRLSTRPAGSASKISIARDGVLIFETIVSLVRDYKPLTAFGAVGAVLVGCGLIPGAIVIREFLMTGLVARFPLAVLAVGLVLTGLLVAFAGLMLHSIARHFQELDYQMQELLEARGRSEDAAPPATGARR